MPSQRKTNIYKIYDWRQCLRIHISVQTVLQTKISLVPHVKCLKTETGV